MPGLIAATCYAEGEKLGADCLKNRERLPMRASANPWSNSRRLECASTPTNALKALVFKLRAFCVSCREAHSTLLYWGHFRVSVKHYKHECNAWSEWASPAVCPLW
jgi:hypothetical protein